MFKKIWSTLVLSIFALCMFSIASADSSCLDAFTDKEVERMESIQKILDVHTSTVEEKYPGAKVKIQKLSKKISETSDCKGGFEDFDAFSDEVKKLIIALVAKKNAITDNTDPEYDEAVDALEKALGDFFLLGMEKNSYDYYKFDQDMEMQFATKTTVGDDHNTTSVAMDLQAKGKSSQTGLLADTDISGKVNVDTANKNTFGEEVHNEKVAAEVAFDANIQMNEEDVYLTLNDLQAAINSSDPFANTVMNGTITEIKDKIAKKTIHLPLPKEFVNQYMTNISLMQGTKNMHFLNIKEYKGKKTLTLDTNICAMINTIEKNKCKEGIVALNQELAEVGKVTKIGNNRYQLSFSDDGDVFTMTWNEKIIEKIDAHIGDTTIVYKDKHLKIEVAEKVLIEGAYNSTQGIDLMITDLDTSDTIDIKGRISTSKNELTLKVDLNDQEENITNDEAIETEMNIYIHVKSIIDELSSFTITAPEATIEIEEVEELFGNTML